MNGKKILIFSTAYFPLIGGAEVAVKEITDRMNGYDFDMITCRMNRSYPKQEKIGNVNVVRIGPGVPLLDKIYLAFFGHRKALKLHKQNNYCLVWSIMASFGGFAALRFKELTNVKFLLTLQEGDSIDYILKRVRFLKKRFKQIFVKADSLHAISNYLLKWGKDMGFQGKIAKVIPNGVNVEQFAANNSQLSDYTGQTRAELDINSDDKLVITVSRLVEKNGVGDLIKAMEKLPENVKLLVVGSGKLEQELKNLARHLSLDKRVYFLGFVRHDQLPKYLWASDVFCRPSLSEGLGNVFLEAMAAKVPVVGTLVGGIPDFLDDGETGFVCKPGNPRSIAEVIKKVINLAHEKKKEIEKNSIDLVRKKYNWEDITKKMEELMQV
ncbi:MAG: glycosyltransferase [Candidatus Magasanikbacteria bacterium]|nr:glycosyltransferase [Candidatus Magasanikbacteria bacterium]